MTLPMTLPMTGSGGTLADRLDAQLPQTQCRQCGYPACRPYAEAIALGQVPIDRCPPGGPELIERLAAITGSRGPSLPQVQGTPVALQRAVIAEAHCIGCTLCIAACPVDAIIGAPKLLHTVLEDRCTGCMLCLPPCPVDCIQILPAASPWNQERARQAREQYESRNRRLSRPTSHPANEPVPVDQARDAGVPVWPSPEAAAEHKRATIEQALARARARRLAAAGASASSASD